ncbi:LysR family transcriptional regulator [Methylocystaceae bacterium]|nr:LysR family transcriptional regulator [Methylocystaceae bacterium]
MPYLNYHHLKYFRAIARQGGLTKAAEHLNVSPSSLSVQLKALEEQLGHALFLREGKSLLLTDAGKIALSYAESVFKSGDDLLATMRGLSTDKRKILRIGAVANLSRNFQLSFLRNLIIQEDVEIIIHSGNFSELLNQLQSLSIDLLLSNQAAPVEINSEWKNKLISDQSVSLIGHKQGIKQKKKINFPADLEGLSLVLPGRGCAIRSAVDRIVGEAGVKIKILAEVDDMAMLRLIVRDSKAFTIVPPVVVIDELKTGELVEYAQIPEIKESFFCITKEQKFPNPVLKDFLSKY